MKMQVEGLFRSRCLTNSGSFPGSVTDKKVTIVSIW